jgi:hypothetical protein
MVAMRATSKVVALMVAMGLGAIPPFVGLGSAQEVTPPARSARGGIVNRSTQHQFEVFCYESGLRIFVADKAGAGIGHSALSGTATFYHPDSPSPWFARPLRPASTQPGDLGESLDLIMDLAKVPASGVKVTLEIGGLPHPEDSTAKFTVPFTLVVARSAPPRTGQSVKQVMSTSGVAEKTHYYRVAGFYRVESGDLVWIPSPGHYYGKPVQYHTRPPSTGASGHRAARRAPEMGRTVAPRVSRTAKPTQTELYWRPRAFGGAPGTGTMPNRAGSGSSGR